MYNFFSALEEVKKSHLVASLNLGLLHVVEEDLAGGHTQQGLNLGVTHVPGNGFVVEHRLALHVQQRHLGLLDQRPSIRDLDLLNVGDLQADDLGAQLDDLGAEGWSQGSEACQLEAIRGYGQAPVRMNAVELNINDAKLATPRF